MKEPPGDKYLFVKKKMIEEERQQRRERVEIDLDRRKPQEASKKEEALERREANSVTVGQPKSGLKEGRKREILHPNGVQAAASKREEKQRVVRANKIEERRPSEEKGELFDPRRHSPKPPIRASGAVRSGPQKPVITALRSLSNL